MQYIEFTKGNWEDSFDYASTTRFPFVPKFIQEEDCIVNGRNPEMRDGFDYTTIVTKKKYGAGTKILVNCSFESFGAPLITLTGSLKKDENGDLRYGVCQELVLWEKGLNVWDFFMVENELKWHRIMASEFHLAAGVKHEMLIELMDKYIRVVIGSNDLLLRVENLPKEVYIGITGCENINRFYSVKIDGEK